MDTEGAYVGRMRDEQRCSYERRRRSERPKPGAWPPAAPVLVDPQSKAALSVNDNAGPPAGSRAADIRRDMEDWRKRNKGQDFGREM